MLQVGSFVVTIPAKSFQKKSQDDNQDDSQGRYVYKGTINGERLEIQIVPKTGNKYTLKAEGSGAPIGLGNPALVMLRIGNDIGVGTASCRRRDEDGEAPLESKKECGHPRRDDGAGPSAGH